MEKQNKLELSIPSQPLTIIRRHRKRPLLRCKICGAKRETLIKQDVFTLCEECVVTTAPPVVKLNKCKRCKVGTINRNYCGYCLDLIGFTEDVYLTGK